MNSKRDHISVCPDEITFREYMSGSLPEKEREEFREHLKECPFCEDAIEGWSIADENRYDAIVSDLNAKIDERIKEEKNRKGWYWYAAAVIALILATGVLLQEFNSRQTTIVVDNAEKNKLEEKTGNTIIPEPPALNEVAADQTAPAEKNTPAPEARNQMSPESSEDEFVAKDARSESPSAPEEKFMQTVTTDESVAVGQAELSKMESDVNLVTDNLEQQGTIKSDLNSEQFNRSAAGAPSVAANSPAAERYEVPTDKKVAATKASKEKSAEEFDDLAKATQVQTIESAFKSGDHALVLKLCSGSTAVKNTEEYFEVQWYKANSLISLNRVEEAKLVLRELSQGANKYSGKASKKLKSLN